MKHSNGKFPLNKSDEEDLRGPLAPSAWSILENPYQIRFLFSTADFWLFLWLRKMFSFQNIIIILSCCY